MFSLHEAARRSALCGFPFATSMLQQGSGGVKHNVDNRQLILKMTGILKPAV
jgi:hypothetical protein